MKRTFLSKLHRNGLYCIIGSLVLLLGVPLYQLLVLIPSSYANALATQSQALRWINIHSLHFLGYRVLLILGFAFIISLPFTLFRIIVAQEVLERGEEQAQDDEEEEEEDQAAKSEPGGMPSFAWRGKGYAVLAAWAGLFGLLLFAAGTLASTLYLLGSAASINPQASIPASAAPLTGLFAILTFTAAGGLLAMSCLFFGAVIARSGLNLWPGVWVAYGYMALALAALFSASAVEVASAPGSGQGLLSTPAILLFALWVLWFGVMLVRLKPE